MKNKRLLHLFGEIDGRYIAEAAPGAGRRAKHFRGKWAAMAACICIAAAGAVWLPKLRKASILPAPDPGTPETVRLEPITVPALGANGMGFEGYLYYEIADLQNGNPWSEEQQISSLPVYRNGAYDPFGIPAGLTGEQMKKRLNLAADALRLEVLSTEAIGRNGAAAAGETPTELRGKTDCGTISVLADGGITYTLPGDGMALPDGSRFTFDSTTEAEAEKALFCLSAVYADFLAYPEPTGFTWGDYNIYGKSDRRYGIYDASGDETEDILNYCFRNTGFFPNGSGKLSVIRKNDGLLSAEKLGDYPIITAEEAKQRLLAGYYQTSVPAAFPGEECLEKVELVYRTGRTEEIFLPYYRFYVRLTDQMEVMAEGLRCCGAYYVPALTDAYLADFPVYDGAFN